MGQKSTGLDGENKSWWNLDTPVLERDFTWETVEAAIDLDCAEVPHKEAQPFGGLQIFRVKLAV